MKDLIISQRIHGLSWSQRDTWTCHAAVRGCLPRLSRGQHVIESGSVRFCSQCMCVRVWCLPVSLNVCVSIISPRRDPVDCRSCPVVVTVPGAASGTIWPPWKSSSWSDIRAGMQEEKRWGLLRNRQRQTTPLLGSHCTLLEVWKGRSNVNCQILDRFKGFARKMRIIRVF